VSLRNALIVVLLVEALYFVLTRLTIKYLGAWTLEAELVRTALRLGSAACFWYLMKPTILSKAPDFRPIRSTWFIAGIALFLLTPVVVGNYNHHIGMAFVIAIASIPVAIKEEFLFRGIVQNLIESRRGLIVAIVVSNGLFTAWHMGVVPHSAWVFSQVFLAGSLLGFVYATSGSIALAIALHALYDAVFAFTPILSRPFSANWGFLVLVPAFLLIVYWAMSRESANHHVQPTPASGRGSRTR
jgi:membrane protease YdiL (CAAX protease family)